MANDQRSSTSQVGSGLSVRRVLIAFGIAAAVGTVAIGLFGLDAANSARAWARAFGSGLVFAAASVVVGGFFGFLFGIPRVLATNSVVADGGTPDLAGRYGANTNLEQVSDWLTKLLIGATLVQLGAISSAAADFFDTLGPSFGGGTSGSAFAGATVIYFAVTGFLVGWLITRLALPSAMNNVDHQMVASIATLMDKADELEQAGDRKQSHALVQAAAQIATSAAPVVSQYFAMRRAELPQSDTSAPAGDESGKNKTKNKKNRKPSAAGGTPELRGTAAKLPGDDGF